MPSHRRVGGRDFLLALAAVAVLSAAAAAAAAGAKPAARLRSAVREDAGSVVGGLPPISCEGGRIATGSGPIQHVIYLQFDNVHMRRDYPTVPSDLEQMPHLLDFIRGNGTMLRNDHTVLISHTANGVLTALTGVYPDRHGQSVANSFRYYKPDGTTGLGVSFAYWTDGIFDPTNPTPPDPAPNMVSEDGHNAPAPWVPYTRAGCDWGAAAVGNTVLENTGPDVAKVFGADSPEAQEVKDNPAQAFADFVGVAVHCAQGSPVCSAANGGKPDVLPDEPGGYSGFNGLFGHKYVAPQITSDLPLKALNGNVIEDATGHVGFPGFDGVSPAVTLSYVAHMQESGIPVTYGYIADAHDDHGKAGEVHRSYGPGEAGYVQQLRQYDQAFAEFFARLERDGITKDNTLFVVTTEEEDHFVGGTPENPGCNGVTNPCVWTHVDCPPTTGDACTHNVTEINANLRGLLATERGNTTPFQVHSDMAPAFYLDGNPARNAAVTRQFERDAAALTAVDPYTGRTDEVSHELVDRVGMDALHMVTGDPLRTPTFVDFLDPDYFGFAGAPNCDSPCVTAPGSWDHGTFAWNHGGTARDVVDIWAGVVGPGVRRAGDDWTWVDHTDLRPTMLRLLGLADDYTQDGRVVTEILDAEALPAAAQPYVVRLLGQVYKQLNAPVGRFGSDVIAISNAAVRSTDEERYERLEERIQALNADRDAVAARINALLDAATFAGTAIDQQDALRLFVDAWTLLGRADAAAQAARSAD